MSGGGPPGALVPFYCRASAIADGAVVPVQVIREGLEKILYRPGLIERCLAGTGLALEPGETSAAISN